MEGLFVTAAENSDKSMKNSINAPGAHFSLNIFSKINMIHEKHLHKFVLDHILVKTSLSAVKLKCIAAVHKNPVSPFLSIFIFVPHLNAAAVL